MHLPIGSVFKTLLRIIRNHELSPNDPDPEAERRALAGCVIVGVAASLLIWFLVWLFVFKR